ncbi:MAG: hypothetical protein F6K58_16325 [Symploca sp. SIO2E9]|nr:hypothetical protein [Symploca sp. SIO2E9]
MGRGGMGRWGDGEMGRDRNQVIHNSNNNAKAIANISYAILEFHDFQFTNLAARTQDALQSSSNSQKCNGITCYRGSRAPTG